MYIGGGLSTKGQDWSTEGETCLLRVRLVYGGEAHLRRGRLVYRGGGSSFKLLCNIINIIHFYFPEAHSSLTLRPARSLETITALVASY